MVVTKKWNNKYVFGTNEVNGDTIKIPIVVNIMANVIRSILSQKYSENRFIKNSP